MPAPPCTVTSWVDKFGRDWGIEIHWELVEDRYEPVSVEFFCRGGTKWPVNHDAIKRIPLGRIMREARRSHEDLALSAATWKEFDRKQARL